jgi:hypothetical protein
MADPADSEAPTVGIEAALFISLAVILLAVTVRRLGRAQHPTGSRQIHTKIGAREKWF